jgi:dTDP-L-rhamnose 4-epimerase
MYEIEKYTQVNIGGTALLLDILTNTKHSIKKIILSSTRAIYGEGRYFCPTHKDVFPLCRTEENMSKGDFECKCPICGKDVKLVSTTEDSLIHPTSLYGISKHAQEQMIMTICPAIGIAPVAFRYQNVFGAGQSLSNPYTGVLSIFSTRIKNGNEINIFEDGKESRDFIYIDDIVDATILGLEKDEANGQIFNVGRGEVVDINTIVDILIKKYKNPVKVSISGNYRLGDIRHNFADISKIKQLLGFQPKYNFEQGIHKFVDWVNQQEVKEDNYEKSIKEMKEKGLYK